MAATVLLAAFSLLVSVSATTPDEPSFVEPIQNVTVTAGRDVKLTCVVDDLGTYKIAWIAYDKSAILTVQEHVITRNPRINVTHDGYRTWTLHIQRVNASDAGTYMCQVNTIVAKSRFGFINVVVPPNIIDSESSGDVMVQEGANVTLVCSATGTPPPSIIWRREDGKVINLNKSYSANEYNGTELVLSRISRTDIAAYLCIARNGVSPTVSKRIQVSVDFPPMMTIPHQLVGSPVNYNVTLECTIEAHPPPLTYWTKGSGETAMLHQSYKYLIEDQPGDVSYRRHMRLTIRNIQPEDFSPYKCIAKNSRGETEGEMKLYKSEPPTTTARTPSYFDKIFKEKQNKPINRSPDISNHLNPPRFEEEDIYYKQKSKSDEGNQIGGANRDDDVNQNQSHSSDSLEKRKKHPAHFEDFNDRHRFIPTFFSKAACFPVTSELLILCTTILWFLSSTFW